MGTACREGHSAIRSQVNWPRCRVRLDRSVRGVPAQEPPAYQRRVRPWRSRLRSTDGSRPTLSRRAGQQPRGRDQGTGTGRRTANVVIRSETLVRRSLPRWLPSVRGLCRRCHNARSGVAAWCRCRCVPRLSVLSHRTHASRSAPRFRRFKPAPPQLK